MREVDPNEQLDEEVEDTPPPAKSTKALTKPTKSVPTKSTKPTKEASDVEESTSSSESEVDLDD